MTTELHEVMRTLGRIENKVDTLVPLHERVRSLEKTRAWQRGAYAAVAVVAAFLTNHLGIKF